MVVTADSSASFGALQIPDGRKGGEQLIWLRSAGAQRTV